MKRSVLLILCSLIIGSAAMAQMTMPAELAEIQRQMCGYKDIAYEYTIEQTLPDGTVSNLKGTLERRGGLYTESNGEQLIIQTEKWWYKLDHPGRTVFIIDAEKL